MHYKRTHRCDPVNLNIPTPIHINRQELYTCTGETLREMKYSKRCAYLSA